MRYRKLNGLTFQSLRISDIREDSPLSGLMNEMIEMGAHRLMLCGSLASMSRAYVDEPLGNGWQFSRRYVHKFRSPVYELQRGEFYQVNVKLAGESWFPGCEVASEAIEAMIQLGEAWQPTGLPLLSTPAKTGQALLWQSLPKDVDFPSLPDGLAVQIKSISPQHRLEKFSDDEATHQYDGRWMYASLCTLDRLPVGEARRVSDFVPFLPGWYKVEATIPMTWDHVGLLPCPIVKEGELKWDYPREAGAVFTVWASEPELTLARESGWSFKVLEGWRFERGRPLVKWAQTLIDMREKLSGNKFAAAAVREILNHTIGAFHVNTVEREQFISDSEWKNYVEINGWPANFEKIHGGRIVPVRVKSHDKLSIFMPHWSAQIWALERARVAKAALSCERSRIVRINGDAIYSNGPLDIADNGRLGQLRLKGVSA